MGKDVSTWGLVRDGRAPFVGRDAEIGALHEALEAVKKGETRIVTLVGPAGIGKSRLIQEFILHHRAPGLKGAGGGDGLVPRVYRGSARDAGAAYGLFAKLLRARFGLVEGMDKNAARSQIRAQVEAVQGHGKVEDVVYFLGQFLGIQGEESPLTRAVSDDPREAAIIRRAVFKAFLEADAATSPICLVFEDLHGAHDDSLSLLRYLLEYLSGSILMLCTARPDLLARQEDFARAGEARHKLIELGPLSDADATAIMQHLLSPAEGGPPPQLVESACAFASGNPLLLEQMVRIYHDKGVLEEVTVLSEEPRWRVDLDKLEHAKLPITIEDAVNARIAALDAYEVTLLEQAAAMGAVFWSGAFVPLSRMGREAPALWDDEAAADVEEVEDALLDMVERDYILKLPDSTFPGTDEYVFKHNREREAIQKRTKRSSEKRYHHGIADWMEHQASLRQSEEYVAMLAEHREKAGDSLRAGLAYIDAGDVARDRYASGRACEYYQKGLGLLGDAFPGRRIDALHHYGDVLQLSGRVDDALAAFREMLTLAYRLDLKSKGGAAHNRIGRAYRETGALEEASKHLFTGMALFEAVRDERGVASSIDDIGKLHWLRGEYEQAKVALKDGLSRRRKLADRRSIALSLNNLGLALQDSGDFKEAVEVFSQSLQIRRDIGDLVGVVVSLNNLGTVAQDQRDFPNALEMFNEALEVAKQIGDRNKTSLVLTNVGEVHYRMGKPAEAIAVLQQAEDLCDEVGDKLGLAEALRGLGKAYLLQGDLPKARDAISRAVDLFAAVRSKVHLGIALRTLGEITAAGGWGTAHTKSAREYFSRAATIFEQTGNDLELARTFKAYSKFLLDSFTTDETARRDALAMNARAEAIFTRLRITQGPVDPGRGSRP
ncbi:Adenylate cyclase [Minicystis rosea]|nr:Adenylate cyclase [Minicystis rosea]